MKARLVGILAALAVLVLVGAGSGSSCVLTQMAKGQTRTTVTSSVKGSAVYGQPVTFTATVERLSGSSKFSGKVHFYDGSGKIVAGVYARVDVNRGVWKPPPGLKTGGGNNTLPSATFTITFNGGLVVATHTITAVYTGSSEFAGSTSRALKLTVTRAATLVAWGTTLRTKGSVKLTAKVTAKAPSHAIPTGVVTFLVDRKKVGSGLLRRGMGTFTITFQGSLTRLAVGKHSATAVYGGGSMFTGSTSRPQTLKVVKVATKTKLAVSPNPSVFGQPVTFTATVTSRAGVPKGSVQFMDGGVTVASGDLNGDGVVEVTVTTLGVGAHSITGRLLVGTVGGVWASSTSPPQTQTVNQAGTATTAVSTLNESPAALSVTFTVTVTPNGPGAGTPTGTVTFTAGASNLGSATLSGGKGTLTVAGRPTGTVTATYSGDANFAGSSKTVK